MDPRFSLPGLMFVSLMPVAVAAAADFMGIDAAQKVVYPEADAFQEIAVQQSADQLRAVLAQAGAQPPHGVLRIWRASRNGTLLGHFFVDEVIGRQDFITYAVGIDAGGQVRNLEIMSYRESHGGEVRNPGWRGQFNRGADLNHLRFSTDIKNISGATLSSEHVTQGVRWLVALWQAALRPAGAA